MFIDADVAYEVLERCQDLFPEWKKEGDQYWNSETGEIIRKDGIVMHDLVYRGYKHDLSHEIHLDKSTNNNDVLNDFFKPKLVSEWRGSSI